jgi:hypothetical protein
MQGSRRQEKPGAPTLLVLRGGVGFDFVPAAFGGAPVTRGL